MNRCERMRKKLYFYISSKLFLDLSQCADYLFYFMSRKVVNYIWSLILIGVSSYHNHWMGAAGILKKQMRFETNLEEAMNKDNFAAASPFCNDNLITL